MMQVELGNPNPTHLGPISPAITYLKVEGTYAVADTGVEMEVGAGVTRTVESAADLAVEVMRQLARGGGITHIPDQEAILGVVAAWNAESSGPPSWVWSDNDAFAALLGEFFGCPVGRPDDLEATHHTYAGAPGIFPAPPSEEPTE